jgi:hypothetical protein
MSKKPEKLKEETKELTFDFIQVKELPLTNSEIKSAEYIKLTDHITHLSVGTYRLDLHGPAKTDTICEALSNTFKNERDTVEIRRLNGNIYVIKN